MSLLAPTQECWVQTFSQNFDGVGAMIVSDLYQVLASIVKRPVAALSCARYLSCGVSLILYLITNKM